MKLVLGGDVFLGGDLASDIERRPIDHPVFQAADARVINLEQAISDLGDAQEKCTLFTGSGAARFLQDMDITALGIANNHIHDMGLPAIEETIGHVGAAGIVAFGAGATLDDARRPHWLTDDIAVLGYCEFDRPYLKNIAVAADDRPGVTPLRLEQILADLERLPAGKTAILFFHWGREHVFFPPRHDIELACSLLKDDRVALIVGMHAHVVQGYISFNGKRAYMGIGNLLFPNFFIAPPTQIHYPPDRNVPFHTTRRYHAVYGLTYKKWRNANRTSLLLEYDTETRQVAQHVTLQDDDKPIVRPAPGPDALKIRLFVAVLSLLYQLPRPVYALLEGGNKHAVNISLKVHNTVFAWHQKGFGFVVRKFLARATGC